MLKTRKRLGDLLVEAGLVSPENLEKALSLQKKTSERLGKVLLDLGYITEDGMMTVLEYQLGLPRVDLSKLLIAADAAALLPVSMAERYHIIPLKKEGRKLTLAMVDPTNFFAIDDVRMASGCEVEPVLASEDDILQAIQQVYGIKAVEKAVSRLRPQEETAKREVVMTSEDAPVISIVNSLITQAIRERASDIHLEPQDNYLRVRFRVDGVMREAASFPRHAQAAIVSRIKVMSELDITEKRLPQDGRIMVKELGREIDIRISVLPTIAGEKVVMRILDKENMSINMDHLGFSSFNLACYRQLYGHSHGMILLTGPTGSGKTTTLYSTLREVSTADKNTITIEDPVEYRLEGVNQVQVNQRFGLDFATGLRSILRQDPNIIMVGEIRDNETADIAIRAALTGHLVFSTLHTNEAAGAITRLLDMQVEPFLVASSVVGVVAQRLVRLICSECKESYIPESDSPERLYLDAGRQADVTLYKGNGCQHCAFTGYHGRMAIQEVMPMTAELRDIVQRREPSSLLADTACRLGMQTIKQDGIVKALAGYTTLAEVMRVAYNRV